MMGATTGIGWTDSSWNSWFGCTKVGPACDDCYAEVVDVKASKHPSADGVTHWGHGAPRRLLSENTRNEPYRWQRGADKFEAEHGRRRRVFTLSMGDLFDNEVPDQWRKEHFDTMWRCDRLEWQVCTKRVSNIAKMVPGYWTWNEIDRPGETTWPRHVGVLITVVTQAEADRDVPRLLSVKKLFGIPWVGVSYEPAQEGIGWTRFLGDRARAEYGAALDWIIFGGKSGGNWNDRHFDFEWGRATLRACELTGTAFFMKQGAAFRPTDSMIPADLMIRQWPKGH